MKDKDYGKWMIKVLLDTVNMVALNSEHQKWETILQYWRERKNNLKKLDSDNNKKYSRCQIMKCRCKK